MTADELALLFPELEVIRLLGRGGMGVVYQARQPLLERVVALKLLPSDSAENPQFAERFRREAAALANLKHPNIVTLYDFGERAGFLYFLMEYVDGPDLAQCIRQGVLDSQKILRIVSQLCDALEFSHRRGVIHRDIKPANILLDQSDKVKVADFGLVKLADSTGGDQVMESRLTLTNMALGTPRYMAPEQMDNDPDADHRVDLYALGVVLYEMLTGEPPAGNFELPSALRSDVDERMDDVVLRAMESSPVSRYHQASDIKTEVAQAFKPKSMGVWWNRHRMVWLRVLPVILVAAAISVAGVMMWSHRRGAVGEEATEARRSRSLSLASGQLQWFSREDHALVERAVLHPVGIGAGAYSRVVMGLASAAGDFGLVLGADGKLHSWGNDPYGQVDVPVGLRAVQTMTMGRGARAAHILALDVEGQVWAWGDDSYGQATPPNGLTGVVQVAAGQWHSVALRSNGSVVVWGYSLDGVLDVPIDLPPIQAIAAGSLFTVALSKEGEVFMWGSEKGLRSRPSRGLLEDLTIRQLVAGPNHVGVLTEQGKVLAWGERVRSHRDVFAGVPIEKIFGSATGEWILGVSHRGECVLANLETGERLKLSLEKPFQLIDAAIASDRLALIVSE